MPNFPLSFSHCTSLFGVQANATGRSAKSVREFLEKHYSPEAVQSRDNTVMLAIKALLEVVQSGSKSMELAVMERGKQLEVRRQNPTSYTVATHTGLASGRLLKMQLPCKYTYFLQLSESSGESAYKRGGIGTGKPQNFNYP